MVKGAFAKTLVTRPLRDAGRVSTTAEAGMNASLNSELRDAVDRIPITFQSSLNSKPGVLRGSIKQERIVTASGVSSHAAPKKKKSAAMLWVPKILRPLMIHPPSAGVAVVRGRRLITALSGSEPEPAMHSFSPA